MRGGEEAANRETVDVAASFLGQGVCALDLAGAEALYPAREHAALFAHARSLQVPFTLHAGEAAGPESVRQALELGAQRIGHGVRKWRAGVLALKCAPPAICRPKPSRTWPISP